MTTRSPECSPVPVTYEPWRGELTGLVVGCPMPEWAVAAGLGSSWDTAGAWWVECLATYQNERVGGLIIPVVPPPGGDVLVEAARVLARGCVASAIVCHVTPPMSPQMVLKIRELNAALVKERRNRVGVSR